MKIYLLIIINLFSYMLSFAQEVNTSICRTTVYPQFVPAIITLENGQIIQKSEANIFMVNGALLYKRGRINMQAEMKNIKQVDFEDHRYIKVDTILAYIVDTLNNNKLLCATMIDLDTYKSEVMNNRLITNLELGSYVNVSTTDLSETNEYPIVSYYYYEINGKIIKAHERAIIKYIPRNKRREFDDLLENDDFSWNSDIWLMRILKLMTR